MKEQFRQKRESSGAVGHSKDIPGCKTLNVKSAGLQSEVCNPISETDDLKRWPAGARDTNRTIRQGEVETVIHETHPGGRGNTPKEAEQQYREFFEAMNKGTVTMTAKGLILCCNQRFAELVKVPLEKVPGMSFMDFVSRDLGKTVTALIAGVDRESRSIDCLLKVSGSKFIPVSISASLLKTEDMEAVCIVVTDLSVLIAIRKLIDANKELATLNEELRASEERLRQSEEHYRFLFESMRHGVVCQDSDGKIISMNAAAERILGRTKAEFIGQTSVTIEHDTVREDGSPFPGVEHPALVSLRTGREVRNTVMGVYNPRIKDYRVIDINAVPMFREGEDKPCYVYTIFDDIAERKLTEEALKESEAKYRNLFENMTEEVHFWRLVRSGNGQIKTWRLVDANPPTLRTWGKTLDEIKGKTTDEIFGPGATDHYMNVVQKITTEGVPFSFEDYFPNLDKHFRFTSIPLGDYFITTGADITDLKKAQIVAEQERAQLEAVYEAMADGVVVFDMEGRAVLVNEAEARLCGYAGTEEMKRDLDYFAGIFELADLDGRLLPVEQWPVSRVLRGESVVNWELRARRLDTGGQWFFSFSGGPVRDAQGRQILAVVITRDITERKKAEAAIRTLNEELKDNVVRLEASNRELEGFSYSVSHDLRAPLRHITGFADLLERRYRQHLDEKGLHYLSIISQAARKMGLLIDDLLEFSRMGRAEIRMKRVSMGALVRETVEEMHTEVKERNIEWKIGKLPDVYGDPSMLKLVLANLISNAVKFSCRQPRAIIEIGCREEKDESVFFVRDNGAGFDMKYVDKLFGVFQRLHKQEEFEGTGIGLSNVRRIVSRHGGRTWAEGSPGGGATFYFSLAKIE